MWTHAGNISRSYFILQRLLESLSNLCTFFFSGLTVARVLEWFDLKRRYYWTNGTALLCIVTAGTPGSNWTMANTWKDVPKYVLSLRLLCLSSWASWNCCMDIKLCTDRETSPDICIQHPCSIFTEYASKQASSSLLLAFASMVILGVEPHRDPWPYFCSHI
jgi:hypothetical protein